ELNFSPGW
nr:red pigment-concentrating hormone [Metacarcinus magister]